MQPSKNQSEATPKLLIIRFSSFGDIVQAMGIPSAFGKEYPAAQIDWLVRSDFASLLIPHPAINTVFSFDRNNGLGGLVARAWKLSRAGYTHLYDAHNNVRSNIFKTLFWIFSVVHLKLPPRTITRSKFRLKRFALFRFRKNFFPKPFRSIASFQKPLSKWLRSTQVNPPQFFIERSVKERIAKLNLPKNFIALAPSAAWEMKRWPVDHWKSLILKLSHQSFVVLGGPQDQFCQDLCEIAPQRVTNLAGKLSLQESCAVVEKSNLLISNDTGLMHVADQLGVKNLALIGPTAFGYPYHPNSQVAEISLWCKPCSKDGRGKCINEVYKRCLVDLSVDQVAGQALSMLGENK